MEKMSEAQEVVSFLILTKNQGPRKSVNFILKLEFKPASAKYWTIQFDFWINCEKHKSNIYDQAVKNRFATIYVLKCFPHWLVVSAKTIKFSF